MPATIAEIAKTTRTWGGNLRAKTAIARKTPIGKQHRRETTGCSRGMKPVQPTSPGTTSESLTRRARWPARKARAFEENEGGSPADSLGLAKGSVRADTGQT